MKKIRNKKIIILILVIIACCVSYFAFKLIEGKNTQLENIKANNTVVSDEAKSENWVPYINSELGVKFNHPKTINGSEMVFFTVGNVLFITTADSKIYKLKSQIDPNIFTDPVSIVNKGKDIAYGDPKTSEHKHWAIIVDKIKDKNDLEKFIDKNINNGLSKGSKCELKVIRSSKISGVEDVMYGDETYGKDDPNYPFGKDCQINYRRGFKYSPNYGRVAYWLIGQENAFEINDCNSSNHECDIDGRISDSFEFIGK